MTSVRPSEVATVAADVEDVARRAGRRNDDDDDGDVYDEDERPVVAQTRTTRSGKDRFVVHTLVGAL